MRWPLHLALLAACAALLGGCGVDSDSVCHPVNNPCPGDLICQSTVCTPRCNLAQGGYLCPDNSGCDKSSGFCAPFCFFGTCPTGLRCSGNLCVKP
jgi:hypothetical protein